MYITAATNLVPGGLYIHTYFVAQDRKKRALAQVSVCYFLYLSYMPLADS